MVLCYQLWKIYDGMGVMGALKESAARLRWSAKDTELKNERNGQSLLSDHLFYHCFFGGDSSN